MKLRTLIDIQTSLDEEFAWRLKEISEIKTTMSQSEFPRKKVLIRAGIALLYAHWEGFVKNSSQFYLEYLKNQGFKYQELKDCFVAVGLKSEISEMLISNKPGTHQRVIEFIRNELSKKINFPTKKAINTRSNLSSIVFENIAQSIGIDLERYRKRFPLIDENLLKRRNTIAHGDYLEVVEDEFLRLNDEVIRLMRDYKTDIENSLSMSSFKVV